MAYPAQNMQFVIQFFGEEGELVAEEDFVVITNDWEYAMEKAEGYAATLLHGYGAESYNVN